MIENNITAIIPARGGSKGIIGKNLYQINSHPLIYYTLKEAKESNIFERIILTSDDDNILNYASSFNVMCHKRPAHLSTDSASSESVIHDVLKKYDCIDSFMLLQPTSPLRSSNDIKNAFSLFYNENCDSVISVQEEDNSCLKYFTVTNNYLNPISSKKMPFIRRQDLPKVFKPNGAIYISSMETFKSNDSLLTTQTLPYVMSTEASLDIDSLEDIEKLNNILKGRCVE